MAIALGRSITDPWYLFLQIVLIYSLHFIVLGLSMLFVRAVSVTVLTPDLSLLPTTAASSTAASSGSVISPYTVTFADLLGSQPRSNHLHRVGPVGFSIAHAATAVLMGFVFARVIERRKFVLDFTFTLFSLSFITSWALGGAFPTRLIWWVSAIGSTGVLYAVAMRQCRLRELQEIDLGTPTVDSPQPPPAGSNVATSSGGGAAVALGGASSSGVSTATAAAGGINGGGGANSGSTRILVRDELLIPGSASKQRKKNDFL